MKTRVFLSAILTAVSLFFTESFSQESTGTRSDTNAFNAGRTLLQTGNVGVGITTPPAKLSVSGLYSDPSIPGTSSTGILRIGVFEDDAIDIGKMGSPSFSGWLQVGYQGSQIDPLALQPLGGNVGIGITAPAVKLHVAGKIGAEFGTSTSASYLFGDGSENTGFSSPYTNTIGVIIGGSEKVRITSDGRIGLGTTTPANTALLDIASNTKGFLPPRMASVQRTAISSPATGLLVYQLDAPAGYYYYTGTHWVGLITGTGAGATSTCIDYDGNAYPTFTIGTQVWMAENLRVTHYRNGDVIPNVTEDMAWEELTTGAYCWYNNDLATNGKYGALYNWHALDDSRGLCPVGWKEPTDEEWTTLITYLAGESFAGGRMKSLSALWTSPNTDATNSSGYSGLPAGYRHYTGYYHFVGDRGFWWTKTEGTFGRSWFRSLVYYSQEVIHDYDYMSYGYSVRCLRDD